MNKALNPSDASPFVPSEEAPQWFLDNIQKPGESHFVAVEDGDIHFLAWNWSDTSLPTLIFVHGFSGHARWWSFLMPFFADRYRVAAIDLPGMGDSSAFTAYDDECFARSILGLIRHYALAEVTIIGHSFGGAQAMRAMAMAPELFAHGIIVDTIVRFTGEEYSRQLEGRSSHKLRSTRAECMENFRLIPPQPEVVPVLVDYVAHHSCTGNGDGWHWKFDPQIRNAGEIRSPDILHQVRTRVDCIYGEQSLFSADNLPQRILESFPNHGQLILVPDAHHHLMLDHPLELVAAIKRLLEDR